MSGWVGARTSARLLCLAAFCVGLAAPAHAQTAQPSKPPIPAQTAAPQSTDLDPSAPLDAMPDLGVPWPDLKVNGPTAPAANAAPEGATTTRYSLTNEGLDSVGNAEELLTAFRQQSALEADRKDPANAAQIDRRSRADADLLEQLLRSQGYYDAAVEPRTERVDGGLRVVLTADPGQQ